ncbi:MAG: hypothetical protein H8J66_06305 [Nitrospira sp.]|nr:hypothetical protein [Nitrospira sp.]
MFFEAETNQINQLSDTQLVELMKRLILEECRLIDIPLRATTVPLQITVADGGEDGRVEWRGGLGSTAFFPTRFNIFQSKARNLTEASITSEVLKKPKKGPAKLNPAISRALKERGAYVVFCSHAFGGQKIDRLRKAVLTAIRRGKKNPKYLKAIEIYDANRIANWVNTHPPVALWLASLKRGRSLAGFQSHEVWGREDEITKIPWINDEMPRFKSINISNAGRDSQGAKAELWNFIQAAGNALGHLAKDKAVLRIAGPSGFGKTRFAFELFNRQELLSDELDRAAVIYADLRIVGEEVGKLALEIADSAGPAILVVDECPDDLHMKLAAITCRAGSRLRLVTIDVETKIQDSQNSLVIRFEPASDKTIGSIAKAVAPRLSDADSSRIQELAKGFPKMAVLAARQNGSGRQSIISAEELVTRIVWGRRQQNGDVQKSLEVLSLFESVGLTGQVAEEGKFIAERIGGINQDTFVEHIKSISSRGVILKRGDYVQVAPIPLAASLGANRLALLPTATLVDIFLDAPVNLRKSLLRRMKWLDTSPEAKALTQSLLADNYLGNLATLNTDSGTEYIGLLIHVDPELVMATIQRVFGSLSLEELKQVNSGRRHLVWALEKLVFRRDSFDTAATLLRRLAASETEQTISNNATGQFTQLFQIYLSGTEASPDMRLLVLDDGLRSPNQKEREVCIAALNRILETGHFSRGGGAEEIGTQERLRDWEPTTYGEILDYLRAALERLTAIALSNDPFAKQAKDIIGSHIRGLIGKLPFQELKATISHILSRYSFWPEAVEKVNEWLYFDRKEAPQELGTETRAYFDELMPTDPVDLAILYTHGWGHEFHDPDIDYDQEQSSQQDFEYATRKAIRLAELISLDSYAIDRALDRFVVSEGKTVSPFARRLAELAQNGVALFKAALDKTELLEVQPNMDFFGGLIAGVDTRDPIAARECIRMALRSSKLKKEAISLIGSGKLQPADIELVISLLQSGDVKPWQCATLSYGRRMAHLEAQAVLPLLGELMQCGPAGLLAAIDIITMILHGGKELTGELLALLRSVLLDPRLFDAASQNRMMGHNLERMIALLARLKLIDHQFAQALIDQLLSICSPIRADVFHELSGSARKSLSLLLGIYPREVWTRISKLLVTNDYLIRHQINWLFRDEHDNFLGARFSSAVPANLYLEWVREDPSNRASIVTKWLPITTTHESGNLEWHPAIKDFISEFGEVVGVLPALSSRLHPMSGYGSVAPHLQPLIKLLESWLKHPSQMVRQWARDRIKWIKTQADQ